MKLTFVSYYNTRRPRDVGRYKGFKTSTSVASDPLLDETFPSILLFNARGTENHLRTGFFAPCFTHMNNEVSSWKKYKNIIDLHI